MYEKEVKVVKKLSNNNVLVSCPEDKCSGCKSKLFCGAKDLEFVVRQDANKASDIKEGDNISIAISLKNTILSLFLVFVIPLIFMVAFVTIAYCLNLEQKYQAFMSILGVAVGMLIEYLINKFLLKDRLKAEVVGKVDK